MWHQSKSDPRKVYDSFHAESCIASTPELAAFIVRAANAALLVGATVPIRLSEPAPNPLCPPSPFHSGPAKPLDIVDPDECCGPLLVRALAKGFTTDSWLCPKCTCEWESTLIPGAAGGSAVRRWSPVVIAQRI
jgi:hypothetical protein